MLHVRDVTQINPTLVRAPAKVTILMGVYNGAKYLAGQLASIAVQTHRNWTLIASDDGSTDGSIAILNTFAAAHPGQVVVVKGPRAGHAANYLSLLRNLPDEPGWIAFSDQDDVWLPEKLENGLTALESVADDVSIHFTRTWVVSEDLHGARLSPAHPKPPSFRNALVQNIASGNTILASPKAAALLVKAARRVDQLVVHDWFIYQLITGCGGIAISDDRPTLLYRQHGANSIGANDGFRAKLHRVGMIFRGIYAKWNDTNLTALSALSDLLTPDSNQIVRKMCALRQERNPLRRISALSSLWLYRQTKASQGALYLTALLGKL